MPELTPYVLPLAILPAVLYAIVLSVLITGLARRHEPDNINTQCHDISIVIAARNEENALTELFESLARIDYPAFEIIFVDDRSTDGTLEIARKWEKIIPQLQVIHVDRLPEGWTGKKHALHQAVRISSGEIIAVTDADCVVPPGWLRTVNAWFSPDTDVVWGFSACARPGDSAFVRLQGFDLTTLFTTAAAVSGLGRHLAASGSNLFYRRSAFEMAGGYHAIGHIVSGDDDLLLQRIAALHPRETSRIRFCDDPGAVVYTRPQPSLKALYNQKKRWGSKGRFYSRGFQLFLLFYWLINLLALTGIVLAACGVSIWWLTLPVVMFLTEGEFYLHGTIRFRRVRTFLWFPVWFFLRIPWILFVGLAAQTGSIDWKGNRYDKPHVS